MHKIKHLAITALSLLISAASFAQVQLPETVKVFYPHVLLDNKVISESDVQGLCTDKKYGQTTQPSAKKHWIAFSDRTQNVTYKGPNQKSGEFGKLSFNEEVYIADIKNDMALVYSEPEKATAWPQHSSRATVKGWIPMSNLLLWHTCPANSAGIYNKALFCVDLSNASASGERRLYGRPDKKGTSEEVGSDMNFYFIMKKEGKMALLSSYHSTEGKVKSVLVGWIGEGNYTPWSQRSCLEFNWNVSDVEYFKKNRIKASIFDSQNMTGKPVTYYDFPSKEGKLRDRNRMAPNFLRFPILDNCTDKLYHCSTFGRDGSTTSVSINDAIDSKDEKIRLTAEAIEKLSHINIGIVIDGTGSMKPYFPAVKNAILQSARLFTENDMVRFGVTIYRHYSDGEYVTEDFKLSKANNSRLKEFLDNAGSYGTKSKNPKPEEAMFFGINHALDQFKFDPDESNILIVVGDCGNDRDDNRVSAQTIVDKVVAQNIHFMSFQVENASREAYSLFNEQLQGIMLDAVQKQYDIAYSHLTDKEKQALGGVRPIASAKPRPGGYTIVNNMQGDALYFGSAKAAAKDRKMGADELTNLIKDAIDICNRDFKRKQEIYLKSVTRKPKFESSEQVTGQLVFDDEFVRRQTGGAVETKGQLLSFEGWTKKQDSSGRNLYKPIVFISSDELTVLLERLQKLYSEAERIEQTNDREPYINALKALIRGLVPDISEEDLFNMDTKDVMNMVSGLNESSAALKNTMRPGFSIKDIANKDAVPLEKYISMVQNFIESYRGLQKIQRSPYIYQYKINDCSYYWLPIEDLP